MLRSVVLEVGGFGFASIRLLFVVDVVGVVVVVEDSKTRVATSARPARLPAHIVSICGRPEPRYKCPFYVLDLKRASALGCAPVAVTITETYVTDGIPGLTKNMSIPPPLSLSSSRLPSLCYCHPSFPFLSFPDPSLSLFCACAMS